MAKSALKLYTGPVFARQSRDYYVEANGEPVFVHGVTVSAMPTNELWRGTQRTEEETEQASFINFDFEGSVTLRIICAWEIFYARVLPASKGIAPVRGEKNKGDEVTFTITKPGQYILEINGLHKPLHIFANPMVTDAPDPNAPNVLAFTTDEKVNFPGNFYGKPFELPEGKDTFYFGPGEHMPHQIKLKSNQKVYIDGGAVVYGTILATHAENIRIYGRGILDCSRFGRDNNRKGLETIILLDHCEHAKVDGVILRDSVIYQLATTAGAHLEIDNIKLFSWRRNSDGIDLHNTSHVYIHDCFVRVFDDAIVIKGQHNYMGYSTDDLPVEDYLVERCTIWGDWGRGIEFGAETSAPYMKDIVLRDCDIIHFAFVACDIQACGSAPIYNVVFEDIRVGDPIDPLIYPRVLEIFIRGMLWMAGESLGCVHDITFRNITYNGLVIAPCRFIGESDEHDIRNIHLENIVSGGVLVDDEKHMLSPIIVNEFANDITLNGRPVDKSKCRFETEEDTCSNYLVGNGAFIVV